MNYGNRYQDKHRNAVINSAVSAVTSINLVTENNLSTDQ